MMATGVGLFIVMEEEEEEVVRMFGIADDEDGLEMALPPRAFIPVLGLVSCEALPPTEEPAIDNISKPGLEDLVDDGKAKDDGVEDRVMAVCI